MPPRSSTRPRRSYDQYCAAARALDAVGDRWTLLIVRELLAGPRRYTDLHADLPGVSTDVLASRLKDMEQGGIASRRRMAAPVSAYVYELTPRGRALLPVLEALGEWGAADLGERAATDAVRAHWFALPLRGRLEALGGHGVVHVRLDEGEFLLWLGDAGAGRAVYADGGGEAEVCADARVVLSAEVCVALARGELGWGDAVRSGGVVVEGEGVLAKVLREG
ncbi:winged helix-turn-helix transcriptional regulator [Streptomyces alboflavus]|uniref:winged helix-turn-helix transcriptional regulator n=1 Tax=Streptomyces alboflavus TaxID=67267 RepID=UPI0004C292DF|nr:helix-turn-helix domain-containing protein [Streptomyces alboflavus]